MNKTFFTISRNIVIVSALMVGMNKTANAEMITGVSLNAQATVDAFNSTNGGKGYYWWASSTSNNSAGNATLAKLQGGYNPATVDLGAYPGLSGQDAFISVYMTSNNQIYGNAQATGSNHLSYDSVSGTTGTKNQPDRGGANFNLSVGAAYLYMMLATDQLAADPWSVATNNTDYFNAFQILNGGGTWSSTNQYLLLLSAINSDTSYWYSDYNPDAFYTEIGNYSIFVLNANSCDDYLYIAKAADPYDNSVPEPGTMLILGLGLVGLPFARRLKKS